MVLRMMLCSGNGGETSARTNQQKRRAYDTLLRTPARCYARRGVLSWVERTVPYKLVSFGGLWNTGMYRVASWGNVQRKLLIFGVFGNVQPSIESLATKQISLQRRVPIS